MGGLYMANKSNIQHLTNNIQSMKAGVHPVVYSWHSRAYYITGMDNNK